MSTLDRICSVVSERHTGRVCVTASVDSMHFLGPAKHGDILVFMASVNRTWRTSMELGAKVMAENAHSGEKKHIVSAYFTFVALDDRQKPIEISAIIPETPEEQRRFEEANFRRERRRSEMAERASRNLSAITTKNTVFVS